ncbi:MAG: pilus assembly protein PilP [Cycloclasticus sp.]|nr:MAG: pilus assembly protein PilP [Cycloclasticus sp.]
MTSLQKYQRITRSALIVIMMALSGCVSEEFDDLKAYIVRVQAKPATPIEPMPVLKSYETFKYVAEGLRDPFKKVDEPTPIDVAGKVEGPGPDVEREKEELESYPLDTLRMVGTLSKSGELWGLVRANDGVIHRVQPGQYLGQNFGKIIQVQEQQIDLGEWVAAANGKWREREASLALVE